MALRKFANANEFTFYPQRVRNALKYKDFPIQKGYKIQFEENILIKYGDKAKYEVSDITISEGARQAQSDTIISALFISEIQVSIPDFALEPEGLWSKFSELSGGKDIDFKDYPEFSRHYYLRGDNEFAVRNFFNESLIKFFEEHDEIHVECHKNKLLIYKKRAVLNIDEIMQTEKFADELLAIINQSVSQPA
jgi:hypothetical protein